MCPASKTIKDRSLVFPIYSGLFFLLKYGGLIDPSEAKDYEDNLVSNFVEETRLNGDPVHYSRALAMQAEFFSRQGAYEDALICHEKLKKVYDVKKHSALVVEAYSSDRSAQNYGNSVNCLYRLGRVTEALKLSNLVLDVIMPQMDLKNVHNSIIMIYPILWILKNERMPQRAASSLDTFVFKPFDKYFGDKGKTFCLELYKPLHALFHILIVMEGQQDTAVEVDPSLIPWALESKSLFISKSLDNGMANFGRCGNSIGAEICLLLSKLTTDEETKKKLVSKGWELAKIAIKTATEIGENQTVYLETKPVYDELSSFIKIQDTHS